MISVRLVTHGRTTANELGKEEKYDEGRNVQSVVAPRSSLFGPPIPLGWSTRKPRKERWREREEKKKEARI